MSVYAVAPVRERGLKFIFSTISGTIATVAPVRERGLKFIILLAVIWPLVVAPVRERGLKYRVATSGIRKRAGRSREGAWIEMDMFDFYWPSFAVAPVRERGLKYSNNSF